MVPLVSPNATDSVLILSGLLKISGEERFINSHQSPPSKTSRYLVCQTAGKNPEELKKRKSSDHFYQPASLFCGANMPGMLQRHVNQAPCEDAKRPITFVSSSSHFLNPPPPLPAPHLPAPQPQIQALKCGRSPEIFSICAGEKKKKLTLTNSQVRCRERFGNMNATLRRAAGCNFSRMQVNFRCPRLECDCGFLGNSL